MNNAMRSVLIPGSGALKIGEAGEFDYSGSQAVKAFKEEGVRVILINPNIATIQTNPDLADRIYLLPVDPYFIEKVIEQEHPDAIAPGFGGQTALNAGMTLWKDKILEKHGVRVLGTPVETILDTEDRERFKQRMKQIDIKVPESSVAVTAEQCVHIGEKLGFPVMLRAGYSLGGLGSGLAVDRNELYSKAREALSKTPQVLIEEYLGGWKEIEYEVVRDEYDNAVTVCNMENMDPMGIHTGESIVVAPSQTLDNAEYHGLRSTAIRIIKNLNIIGECNIQFAVNPDKWDYRVIEINARLSRSSALASKATGYPLAWVAAKLGMGMALPDLKNAVTGVTGSFFEPAMDYVVVKIPRWDLTKFRAASRRIGSEMKSVGEVMGIGVTFEEALQKAVRMLGTGIDGLTDPKIRVENVMEEIAHATDRRLFAIAKAMSDGAGIEEIHRISGIDTWFLSRIHSIVEFARNLKKRFISYAGSSGKEKQINETGLNKDELRTAKRLGFSDSGIAFLTGMSTEDVRETRKKHGIEPAIRRIDTLAGEFPASTNYLYCSYGGTATEMKPERQGASVMILGSGPYCIGSSVEFDWCSVSACSAASTLGYRTIIVNSNPETVSTDYDITDRLYFEELTLERILDIYEFERPLGVILSMGGQIPNNLALKLHKNGVNILGTNPENIDRAEDRHKFSSLLDNLKVDQPVWKELKTIQEAKNFAKQAGYPVLVRPSYVLSGSAMNIAKTEASLEQFLREAALISGENTIVISKFIEGAKEIEIDGVAQNGELVIYAITEHIELSGVHSGDATVILPPQATYLETVRRAKKITKGVIKELGITGPFNMQFLAKRNELKVIECNLRASRSFPFVSKSTGYNFIDLAARAMLGCNIKGNYRTLDLDYVSVKVPQFSFSRLKGADPVLYVEMTSTGEVACLGDCLEEAYLKALIATGFRLPHKAVLVSIGGEQDKVKLLEDIRCLSSAGLKLYATCKTHEFLDSHNISSEFIYKISEEKKPCAVDLIQDRVVDCIINIPHRIQTEKTITDGYWIRRKAADFGISLINNAEIARLFIRAFLNHPLSSLHVKPLNEYVQM
jgi:carbamoyl-phosphate synthase large subunit